MFTKEQEVIVKETYALITLDVNGKPMEDDEVSEHVIQVFYQNLFIRDPSLRKYFKHLDHISEIFACTLSETIDLLGTREVIEQIINMGKRHAIYSKEKEFSITDKNFEDVGVALIETILSRLVVTPYMNHRSIEEVSEAWTLVYKEIVSIMKNELVKKPA